MRFVAATLLVALLVATGAMSAPAAPRVSGITVYAASNAFDLYAS